MATVEHTQVSALTIERLILAGSRGGCAGVDRIFTAIERSIMLSDVTGIETAILQPPVHYRPYLARLEALGVKIYDQIDEIPLRSRVITRAHGMTPLDLTRLKEKGFEGGVIDGTCPLVDKVRNDAEDHLAAGRFVLHLCHKNHPEAKGVLGLNQMGYKTRVIPVESTQQARDLLDSLPDDLEWATSSQTTLNADEAMAFHKAMKKVLGDRVIIPSPKKDLICYATKWRQDALKQVLDSGVGMVIVVGSKGMSSNSESLAKIAEKAGVKLLFIERASELSESDFAGIKGVGFTLGASVSKPYEEEVLQWFKRRGVQPDKYEPGEMKAEKLMAFEQPTGTRDSDLARLGIVFDSKRENIRQTVQAHS